MNRRTSADSNSHTSQLEINVKDLNKTAKAIRGHDVALKNILDDIRAFEAHLGKLVEAQGSFATGLEKVTSVQQRMVQAQANLKESLDTVTSLADEKVPAASGQLEETVNQAAGTLNDLDEYLKQAKAVTEGLDGQHLQQLSKDLRQALAKTTDTLEQRVKDSIGEAQEHFDQRVDEIAQTITASSENFEAAQERVDALATKVETSYTNFSNRIDRLEQKMDRFQEQMKRTSDALTTRIREREEQLEEDKDTLNKKISRFKSLFG